MNRSVKERDSHSCVVVISLKNLLLNTLVQRGVTPLEVDRTLIAGRLALFRDNWAKISQDMYNRGVQNRIFGKPHTTGTAEGRPVLNPRSDITERGNSENADKRGSLRDPEFPQGFYSSLFLVPKKDGGKRPVINLKDLNAYVPPYHFKMEGLHTLRDILKEGDWMTKVDLKDSYFMIPIHQSDRQFLRFSTGSQHFQFNCLPFGLSCAPWVFTKTLKPVLTLLRELGVRLVAYIDDILVLAETVEKAQEHMEALIYLLENLGYIVHPEKSVRHPTQEIEFLGMMVDSRTRELRLPGQKIKKLRQEAAMMIKDQLAPPTAREVSRLLGKFNSVSKAIPPAPEHYRGT